jgi:hypothetical protein
MGRHLQDCSAASTAAAGGCHSLEERGRGGAHQQAHAAGEVDLLPQPPVHGDLRRRKVRGGVGAAWTFLVRRMHRSAGGEHIG